MSYVVEDDLDHQFCQAPMLRAEEEEVVVVDELVVILKECLGKIKTKSREFLLRKFYFELEKDISMETFIVRRLQQSRVSAISNLIQKSSIDLNTVDVQTTTSVSKDVMLRGLHEPVEELPQKLERFKVKTVTINIADVDKVELPTQAG